MMRSNYTVVYLAIILSLYCREALASPGSELVEFIGRHLAAEGEEKAAQKISEEVGEVVIDRVAANVLKEGGEASLEQVSQLTAKYGPNIIRALDDSPAPARAIKLLEELPEKQVPKVAARLAAGPQGKELMETAIRYGPKALLAEAAHPGIGGRFVRAFGIDGAALCEHLTTDQAVALGRHVDDIAKLPPIQRKGLFELMSTQTDRFVQFVGRFIENNPGKVLFTSATTTVILTNAEQMLGGDEIVYDADGNPRVVSKPGMIQRIAEPPIKAATQGFSWMFRGVAIVVVLFVGGIAIIKLRGLLRRERAIAVERV
jgi:hypothetical protein